MKFEKWLKQQKHRQDPIGDLSRDYINTIKIKKYNKERCNKQHLSKFYADTCVYDALLEARLEYRKLMIKT